MMLSPRTREMLKHAGHSGREFGPSTTRVVGTLPGMKPDPDSTKPQLAYLLPALELRRLLSEARSRSESFTLTYRRISKTGAPFDGRIVNLVDETINNVHRTTCTVGVGRQAVPCDPDEIGVLPMPDQWGWLTWLLLSFPLPMRADGVHELGCLA